MTEAASANQKLSIIGRFLNFFTLPVEEDDGRHRGIVKYTVDHKGYGFIHDPDLRSDLYFHFMDTNGPDLPRRGDKVSFEPIFGARGYRARLVEVESKKESERHAKCSGCGKLMVPRLITHRGEPDTSVCPFCWTTFKEAPASILDLIVIIGLIAALIWVVGEVVPDPYGGQDILSSTPQSRGASEHL
jgi:cold shock CspA family protein